MFQVKSKKKYEIDMCNGPILKKMLLFAIPLVCSGVLQLLFNAADIIVVGRFAGDNSLAAVGATTSLINLLVNFFMGISIGANVLVARYYGSKQKNELDETVHTAITISIVGGFVLTIIGMIFAPTFLAWMKTPGEIAELAAIYLRVYFVGMIPMLIYNYGAAILRAVGDTQRPLYYLIVAGVINVTCNLFFVIVLKWGVFGVGLATTISQTISALLVIRCLVKGEGTVKLDLQKLRVNKNKLYRILQIGIPAGLQSTLFSISNVMIQSSINSFGEIVVAGNAAAANIEGFVYMAMNAFYQANISFTSQNFGAGKYERINRILITSLVCVTVVGAITGGGVYLIGPTLLGIYTESKAVIEAGMIRFGYLALPYALCGIMEAFVGSLRGMGYVMQPMIVSSLGVCGIRLLWIATIFQMEQFHTTHMLYVIYPISWVITILAHMTTYIIVHRRVIKK
ncbi:MAG: MATE family efflux transporter [Tyzzerella sp.]|nr:MATE family efflux transporter [Tyzzerella sp.]